MEPPSGRGRQFESLLGVYTMAMNISSLFALFIGMFIIYNSFAIAVTQRRSEIGILRALGATRGQIRTLFLGESAVAGLIGSAVGAALGLLFARSLTGVTANDVMESDVRRRAKRSGGGRRSRVPGLRRGASGMVTSMVAALIPARNAARVEPMQALQKGRYQVLGAGENRDAPQRSRCSPRRSPSRALRSALYRPLFYAGFLLTLRRRSAAHAVPFSRTGAGSCAGP